MTAADLIAVMKAMREYGVESLTCSNLALVLAPYAHPHVEEKHENRHIAPEPASVAFPESVTEPEAIKHKIEELSSLMKLSDQDLVDELFPDHTETEE